MPVHIQGPNLLEYVFRYWILFVTNKIVYDINLVHNLWTWNIYLSVISIFHSLWFVSGFPWYRIADTHEATEPRIPFGKVEVITSKLLWSPPHSHGYVPLVVSTSCFCPHSWLVTSFVARLTLWVQLVEQELLITSEHISSPSVFSGVHVTRTLVLFVVFCVVYPFSIYEFWLPLWYLQALLILYLLFLNSVWLILATFDYS